MSAIGRRLNNLKTLMSVRNGPGAAKLPANVTKIHMEFAHKWNDGHYGSRNFWRDHLPRLKYHNPHIPMIVNRTHDQHGPATLSIYVRTPDAEKKPAQIPEGGAGAGAGAAKNAPADPWSSITSSTEGKARAPEPSEGETVVTINMKNVRSEEILKQFMERTGARQLEPTAEDREEMARQAELQERAVYDREVQRRYREKIQTEKKMLEKARQEADALKADK
ncbi:54S ribosomal protein MRP49, mitochondrial [Cytospora mali]|uniref:54S ribosomal protein MRP49, mitochondrial n=1 Tax=Cytospora mali TaxID=578113 RepID=A0A194VUR3_CYTMA|nr:54S ribosomal protein MRP49, mitochondrial [Valsa mali]